MTAAGWPACLDDLAQHLVAQRAAIARGDVASIESFAPAPGLGPLPASLRERAFRLQAENAALADLLAQASTRTGEQLHALTRPRTDISSSYVDSRA